MGPLDREEPEDDEPTAEDLLYAEADRRYRLWSEDVE